MIVGVGTTPAVQRTMTFPQLRIDAENRAAHVSIIASGKSSNVMRAAHRLGAPVLATGFAGGASGDTLLQALSAEGVRHDFVQTAVPTRQCITVIDQSNRTATELVEEAGAVPQQAYENLIEKIKMHLPSTSLLVLSGGLPPDAPTDFYARCTAVGRSAGVPVILDTRGEPLMQAIAEKPLLVKPNLRELEQTAGAPLSTISERLRAMAALARRGAEWVLITDGPRDIMLGNSAEFWRISVPAINVVSAVGSGDCVAAGLAVAIGRNASMPDAARFGVACGLANALCSGAGVFDPLDVTRLENLITVQPLGNGR